VIEALPPYQSLAAEILQAAQHHQRGRSRSALLGQFRCHLFVWKQLPAPTPAMLEPHLDFIVPRVLELVCTAYDMTPLARDLGDEPSSGLDADGRGFHSIIVLILHFRCLWRRHRRRLFRAGGGRPSVASRCRDCWRRTAVAPSYGC